MRRCAFLTMKEPVDFVIDDALAHGPLRELGWHVDTLPWNQPGVAWGDYEVVVIRSTWDYHHRPDAFAEQLSVIDRSGTRLLNDLATVRWNMHKTYLRDLAARGVATVPSVFRPRLRRGEIDKILDEVGSDEIVVKPLVGAAAEGAYRVGRRGAHARAREVEACFANRALLAQPMVRAVLDDGEYSMLYFAGRLSHTVRKQPAPGDYRAQEDHGAQIRTVVANDALVEAGARTLAVLGEPPLYARTDFVRANDGEAYWLMELELIEPSLYLRLDSEAPHRFAAALDARMSDERSRPA